MCGFFFVVVEFVLFLFVLFVFVFLHVTSYFNFVLKRIGDSNLHIKNILFYYCILMQTIILFYSIKRSEALCFNQVKDSGNSYLIIKMKSSVITAATNRSPIPVTDSLYLNRLPRRMTGRECLFAATVVVRYLTKR